MVGSESLGGKRLGNKKVDKESGWVSISNVVEIFSPGQKVSFV